MIRDNIMTQVTYRGFNDSTQPIALPLRRELNSSRVPLNSHVYRLLPIDRFIRYYRFNAGSLTICTRIHGVIHLGMSIENRNMIFFANIFVESYSFHFQNLKRVLFTNSKLHMHSKKKYLFVMIYSEMEHPHFC